VVFPYGIRRVCGKVLTIMYETSPMPTLNPKHPSNNGREQRSAAASLGIAFAGALAMLAFSAYGVLQCDREQGTAPGQIATMPAPELPLASEVSTVAALSSIK
jgi:hypothetical protein